MGRPGAIRDNSGGIGRAAGSSLDGRPRGAAGQARNDARRAATTRWRITGILTAAWGGLLLWRGDGVWHAVAGRSPDDVEAMAIRVLGVRQVAQGVLEAVAPGRLPRTLIAIDVLHAASMLALAVAPSPRRRPALVSAAVAASSAAILAGLRRAVTKKDC